jgi:hypothetical protein
VEVSFIPLHAIEVVF